MFELRTNLRLTHKRGYFATKVFITPLESFAHLIASETTNRNLLTGFGYLLGDQFSYRLGRVLNEGLIQQDCLFIKLVKSAFDNLVYHLIWLTGILRIVFGLGPGDVSFLFQISRSHFIARNELRLGRGDMHGNVFHQLLKLLATSDEIGLAIYFDENSDLATH